MTISIDDAQLHPKAMEVVVSDDALTVQLEDGRVVSAPLAWYPRLAHGTRSQRDHFEIGDYGIHWPELDEDISIKGILLGHKSGESQQSLARWLKYHKRGEKAPVKTLPLPEWAKQELKAGKGPASRQKTKRRK